MNKYFVYYDILEETNEIIYCGQGNDQRSNINKKHKRNNLYNSYTKNHKIIRKRFEVQDKETALELEAYLIDIFHTWIDDPFHTKHACNIVQNGLSGFKQHSTLSKKHMSISRCGKKQSIKHINNNALARIGLKRSIEARKKMSAWQFKQVNQYDTYGKYIRTHKSILSATDFLGKRSLGSGICSCCNGTRKYAGGFMWRHSDNNNDIKTDISQKLKCVNQYDKFGNFIKKYESYIEAYKLTNVYNVQKVCSRQRSHAGGFIWRYVDDDEFTSVQVENV